MATLLLASFSFGVGAYYRLNVIDMKRFDDPIPIPGPVLSGDLTVDAEEKEQRLDITGRINILLLGEDNVDQTKRSDTVAFVAIDVEDRNVRVLSLPRDTRVNIPGHGQQKLNHAYAYGKVDLLRATVEQFLGTSIHYYVKIDYDNFPKLVDMVGGVDVNVGKAMKYRDKSQNLYIDIPAGKQRMNGETALKYVRFRNDAKGDIGRVQRQQQFLKSLLHRFYEPENILRFAALTDGIKETLVTDIDPSVILQICLFVRRLEKEPGRFYFLMLPGEAQNIDKLNYWVANRSSVTQFLTANAEQLGEIIHEASLQARRNPLFEISSAEENEGIAQGGVAQSGAAEAATPPSPADVMTLVNGIPDAVAVLNGTGRSGLGQSVASHLQKMGVDVVHVGNAKHSDYKSSNVIYPESSSASAKESAEVLSKLCGISSSLTRANKQAMYPSLIVGLDYEALIRRLENSYAKLQ
ncbi:MAG: LCP family protein [Synergistaceae bacterium]|jgi:LCP family protein required for cell wall assembly|nr:LCP family protein [Synergistaceae bacterium]